MLLGIEIGDRRILLAEIILRHAAGHQHHGGNCHIQQEHRRTEVSNPHVEQYHGPGPRYDGGDRSRCPAGIAGHEAVIACGVLAEGPLHAAPEQAVHIYMEHVAEL